MNKDLIKELKCFIPIYGTYYLARYLMPEMIKRKYHTTSIALFVLLVALFNGVFWTILLETLS